MGESVVCLAQGTILNRASILIGIDTCQSKPGQ